MADYSQLHYCVAIILFFMSVFGKDVVKAVFY